ncbi:outer membrane beta-barrel protein [Cerasicoccus arenae]|uniref:P44/Msp2 family outer membrane protein n=1 Tax=Cerasicoccus arenae TaxID=424488 RepID=A0A8J3DHH7_9BACT|nr:outer membrane beta-barrel protein [Cerasicoccus arenae]MBK1858193.1 porin family protein [Cerasicoccus arenae]GHC00924.1 P44/Msp2 family outer membrane protein [Cerasicoccus arenae]
MTNSKKILAIGAVALLASATQAVAEGGEWYISAKGGANFPDQGLDTGWQIDGGIGYRFFLDESVNKGTDNEFALRLEFNPGFLQNKPSGATNNVNVGRFMGNVLLDVPVIDWAYLYGGLGIGGAYYNVESVDNDFVFAYQGMAGVGFVVAENVKLEVGYRYFTTLDPTLLGFAVTAPKYHAAEAGIRFEF